MAGGAQQFELIPKSYRGIFPFRICVPSFIYPAPWSDNIRLLGPYVDEIEILLFDSTADRDFPSRSEVAQMAQLLDRHGVRCNVHLPTDIFPGHFDERIRKRAVDILVRSYRLVAPLNPTATVLHLPLHLPLHISNPNQTVRRRWQDQINKSIEALLSTGILAKMLFVENIDYPLEWVGSTIERYDLGVCLDVGHLLARQVDWRVEFRRWMPRIEMMHLHGVSEGRDHLGLDNLSPPLLIEILGVLNSFRGTVSIEVFSYENLIRSLASLEKHWQA